MWAWRVCMVQLLLTDHLSDVRSISSSPWLQRKGFGGVASRRGFRLVQSQEILLSSLWRACRRLPVSERSSCTAGYTHTLSLSHTQTTHLPSHTYSHAITHTLSLHHTHTTHTYPYTLTVTRDHIYAQTHSLAHTYTHTHTHTHVLDSQLHWTNSYGQHLQLQTSNKPRVQCPPSHALRTQPAIICDLAMVSLNGSKS